MRLKFYGKISLYYKKLVTKEQGLAFGSDQCRVGKVGLCDVYKLE